MHNFRIRELVWFEGIIGSTIIASATLVLIVVASFQPQTYFLLCCFWCNQVLLLILGLPIGYESCLYGRDRHIKELKTQLCSCFQFLYSFKSISFFFSLFSSFLFFHICYFKLIFGMFKILIAEFVVWLNFVLHKNVI